MTNEMGPDRKDIRIIDSEDLIAFTFTIVTVRKTTYSKGIGSTSPVSKYKNFPILFDSSRNGGEHPQKGILSSDDILAGLKNTF